MPTINKNQTPIKTGLLILCFCLWALPSSQPFALKSATAAANDASLYINIDKSTFLDPEILTIDLVLDSGGQLINVLDIKLDFATSSLSLASSSLDNSPCAFVVEDSIDNQLGAYRLTCGLPGQAATSTPVAHLTFSKLTAGLTKLNINENSAVLAHDGLGTNILGNREIHYIEIIK